ncbi:Lactonase, 7-bladed beta-propeller-domain-containing protein [Aspergillus insuetus]
MTALNKFTLQLTQSVGDYTLSETSALKTCGTYPRWNTLGPETHIINCSDKRRFRNVYDTVNATLTALSVGDDGTLTDLAGTPNAAGGDFLAVAHNFYAAVLTFALPLNADADPAQLFAFDLNVPGTVPDLQDIPHPHQTLLDPTGSFVIVPDLGADLLRVFATDEDTGDLNACPDFNYTIGAGSAHGVFFTASKNQRMSFRRQNEETFLYVAGELNRGVEAFAVSYTEGEIRHVGEDVYVSIRLNEGSDANGSISRLSRTCGGKVEFAELLLTSNDVLPHTFAIKETGDLVAVRNNISPIVAIIEWDGVFGDVVTNLLVGAPGEPDTLNV